MPSVEAAILGASERLRPILMTACAMTVGMVPMALALEKGSQMQAPLGLAVIGGLVMSTFATLLVLPSIFAVVIGRKVSRSPSIYPDDPASRYYDPQVYAREKRPDHAIAPVEAEPVGSPTSSLHQDEAATGRRSPGDPGDSVVPRPSPTETASPRRRPRHERRPRAGDRTRGDAERSPLARLIGVRFRRTAGPGRGPASRPSGRRHDEDSRRRLGMAIRM